MFVTFLGVNNKIINFATIALIEDQSTDDESKVLLTTSDGTELEFTDEDADLILARAETLLAATDELLTKLTVAGGTH